MAEEQATKNISIQKIYVKDLSFESPNSPQVFTEQLTPQTQLNLRSSHREIAEDMHEVILTVTVDAKQEDKTVFLTELQHAGMFTIKGLSEEEKAQALGSFCPSIIYNYAREVISAAIQRGGFPEFILQPIDFDSLYHQSRAQAGSNGGDTSS